MNYKIITDVLIVVVVCGLALYDVLPALSERAGDTISEAVQNAIYHNVVVLFMLSVLIGHFSLPRESSLLGQPASVVTLVGIAWIIFAAGFGLRNAHITISSPVVGAVIIALGLVAGYLLWPLSPK